LGLLLSCLAASWLPQAQAPYGSGLWYEGYDIRAHIDRFAPQNRPIQGLATLETPGQVSLFDAISQAAHAQRDGVSRLRCDWRGRSQPLLHNAEVVHLQDVANLIDALRTASWVIAWLTLALLWWLLRQGCRPLWRAQAVWLGGLVLVTLALVFAIGPKAVFY